MGEEIARAHGGRGSFECECIRMQCLVFLCQYEIGVFLVHQKEWFLLCPMCQSGEGCREEKKAISPLLPWSLRR